MAETDRLIEVTLDESGLAPPTPEVEQERRVHVPQFFEFDPSGDRVVPVGVQLRRLPR